MTIRPLPTFFRPSFVLEIESDTRYNFTIPTHGTGGTYAMYIDWGDGSAVEFIDNNWQSSPAHNYAVNGTYQIKLTGLCTHLELGAPPRNRQLLTKIVRCADLGFEVLSFSGCNNLGELPADFSKLTHLTTLYGAFFQCGFSSIPAGVFDGCVNVTNVEQCFSYSGLITVPADLLKNLVNVTNCNGMFSNCGQLASIPDGFFRYQTACINFNSVFANCQSLILSPYIFWTAGNRDTRFHDQSIDFGSCFTRAFYNSDPEVGTAPDLWACDYGTGTPATGYCFAGAGNSGDSLTNYSSIPSAWIDPA